MPCSTASVSVVLPVHNGHEHLRRALGTVLSDSQVGEVIVVDDASTDETPQLLADVDDARVVVVTLERNQGVAGALNAGLAKSTAEFVARFDADDEWVPGRLSAQLPLLIAEPELAVVGGQYVGLDARGQQARRPSTLPVLPDAIRWRLLFENPIAHPTVTFRRAAVVGAGGYREGYAGAEDYELWLRMWPQFAFANVSGVVHRYRRHSASESSRRVGEAQRNADASAAGLIGRLTQREPSAAVLRVLRERVPVDDASVSEDDIAQAVAVLFELREAVGPRLRTEGSAYVDRWMARRLLRWIRTAGHHRDRARADIRASLQRLPGDAIARAMASAVMDTTLGRFGRWRRVS